MARFQSFLVVLNISSTRHEHRQFIQVICSAVLHPQIRLWDCCLWTDAPGIQLLARECLPGWKLSFLLAGLTGEGDARGVMSWYWRG